MAEARWTPMRLRAVGPSGQASPVGGAVLEQESWNPSTVVSLVIAAGFVVVGLIVPPLLMLAIPVLIARAALAVFWDARRERVSVESFACPECGGENAPGERRGAFPIDLPCGACGAALSVGQVPR